jgi:hypothetical protein
MTHNGRLKEMDMIDYALMTIPVAIFVLTISLGISTIFMCKDIYRQLRKPTKKASNIAFHCREDFMTSEQRIA